MEELFRVVLPLPPKRCSVNYSGARMAKSAAIKLYRDEAMWACMAQKISKQVIFDFPVSISFEFWNGGNASDGRVRAIDICNAVGNMKAAVDGMVDANVIKNDNHRLLQIGTARIYPKPIAKNRAEVVIILKKYE